MGSALTFPFEALVFATCVIVGIGRALNRPLTVEEVQSLRGKVRVYGDDIIVPVEYVQSVVETLEHFGAKVNTNKSYWTGKFRESCGGDYYDGEDVSVVRVRRLFPVQRSDVLETISTVSLRNRMYNHGYWQTARYLDKWLERHLKVYPTISPESPALGRHTLLKLRGSTMEPQKWDARSQSPVVKAYWPKATLPESHLDDVWALQKVLLSAAHRDRHLDDDESPDWFLRLLLEGEPTLDSKHLERHGRPEAVDIKLRWGSFR
jgi:hypothetical protein